MALHSTRTSLRYKNSSLRCRYFLSYYLSFLNLFIEVNYNYRIHCKLLTLAPFEVPNMIYVFRNLTFSSWDVEGDVAQRLKALKSQLLPLKGRSWVRAPVSDKLRVNWWWGKSQQWGLGWPMDDNNSRISIPRVLTNRKIPRIKYGHPTKSLVDGGKTRPSLGNQKTLKLQFANEITCELSQV